MRYEKDKEPEPYLISDFIAISITMQIFLLDSIIFCSIEIIHEYLENCMVIIKFSWLFLKLLIG